MTTAIIGSGITGMTAALLARDAGEEVTLFEAKSRLAPLLSGFWHDGLYFDTGLHSLASLEKNGLLFNWLNALGVLPHLGEENIFRSQDEFRFVGTSPIVIGQGEKSISNVVSSLFSPEIFEKFCEFQRVCQEKIKQSPYRSRHIESFSDILFQQQQSLTSVFSSFSFPPLLQALLGSYCLFFGCDTHQASFFDFMLIGSLYMHSSFKIDGGGNRLVAAFSRALREAGVCLEPDCEVREILVEDGRICALRLKDGEIFPCENCVFTGHPMALQKMLPKGCMRKAYFSHIASMEETMASLCIFGECSEKYLEKTSVYLLPKGSHSLIVPLEEENPTCYVSGGRGHDGRYPFVAVIPYTTKLPSNDPHPRPPSYLAWKERVTRNMVSYMKRRLPEIGTIRVHASATELSMRHWVHGVSGSTYGILHSVNATPILPMTKIRGLVLAGQNILLPGILGGIISAALGIGFLFGHERALRLFRRCADEELS